MRVKFGSTISIWHNSSWQILASKRVEGSGCRPNREQFTIVWLHKHSSDTKLVENRQSSCLTPAVWIEFMCKRMKGKAQHMRILPYRTQRFSVGFVGYESDLTHVLWPSQPPGISTNWRIWSDVFRQTHIHFNKFVLKQKVKATGQ